MEKYHVYRFLSTDDKVVYVGKTKRSITTRIAQHFSKGGHLSDEQLASIVKIEFLELRSAVEMDIVELHYINKWKPAYNSNNKYEEDFLLEERDEDTWIPINFSGFNTPIKEIKDKLRVEIVLTEADADIIEFIEKNDMPRATLFKVAMRSYIQRQDEERFDERVKRLLNEVLAERGEVRTVQKVESKKRLGFGAKKV